MKYLRTSQGVNVSFGEIASCSAWFLGFVHAPQVLCVSSSSFSFFYYLGFRDIKKSSRFSSSNSLYSQANMSKLVGLLFCTARSPLWSSRVVLAPCDKETAEPARFFSINNRLHECE
mmetsp:Transcript_16195/g.31341  ORF Transcript_16195/g.31341 Transcript_16195/m.31341 type:complete len:117 (-) Transcript_16195:403-753(-)